jgi:site-specific DNA-methyltransferase (adenine-specific)
MPLLGVTHWMPLPEPPKERKCNKFYTPTIDGLSQSWEHERVFCNPPYGHEIAKWVNKCYEESKKAEIILALLPARTDTKWFHDYIYGKSEITFIKGRLKFGNSKNAAPFPSMIVCWKRNNG